MQLVATSSSIHTVQAEQAPRSQPTLVPVRPRPSRRNSTSVVAGSANAVRGSPLTCRLRGAACGPNVSGATVRSVATLLMKASDEATPWQLTGLINGNAHAPEEFRRAGGHASEDILARDHSFAQERVDLFQIGAIERAGRELQREHVQN